MSFVADCPLREPEDYVDIVEIFGGAGYTSQLLVRRRFVAGTVFDTRCGVDLDAARHLETLFEYRRRCRPRVLLMSPPCTGLRVLAT